MNRRFGGSWQEVKIVLNYAKLLLLYAGTRGQLFAGGKVEVKGGQPGLYLLE